MSEVPLNSPIYFERGRICDGKGVYNTCTFSTRTFEAFFGGAAATLKECPLTFPTRVCTEKWMYNTRMYPVRIHIVPETYTHRGVFAQK